MASPDTVSISPIVLNPGKLEALRSVAHVIKRRGTEYKLFKEADVGRYYAFYGKASDCFLIRMKNGDKYVLGCENPGAMVDYIKSTMKK
ncbi:MAG: hypothetical protein NC338_07590 [Firmicutes bacterium]|nr:hypothetical protein [Bacillota bacterium]MCM1401868.1 hypothetical protein [Bacteroides sp.]MCM1476723.1 hypothetical protein [Bacteroides sp.]